MVGHRLLLNLGLGSGLMLVDALESPPATLTDRAFAWFWIIALAGSWRSVVYTCSSEAHREIERIPDPMLRHYLLGLVVDRLEARPDDPQPTASEIATRPSDLRRLGLKEADATHVAEATLIEASEFVTYDKGILRRRDSILRQWGLVVSTPGQFLLDSVRAEAPWPVDAPWPWEEGPLAKTD